MGHSRQPAPEWLSYELGEGVTAFSTTRRGGYGKGCYGEFNMNPYCGDDPRAVARNRELLCSRLGIGPDRLVVPHQVHGCEIRCVTDDFLAQPMHVRERAVEGADALMTDVGGVCIGVSTADCIPIIIYDDDRRATCVVHAGWRGTVQRIARKAVQAMAEVYGSRPHRLRAVIGPGISCESFEVGDEVYEQFAAASFPMDRISRRMPPVQGGAAGATRWHVDLWACNRLQLQAAGLQPGAIHTAGICTYLHADDFFSARRLGTASGRILTGIVLRTG